MILFIASIIAYVFEVIAASYRHISGNSNFIGIEWGLCSVSLLLISLTFVFMIFL